MSQTKLNPRPFFKMTLDRQTGRPKLDIDVLSGLVKVGYDREKAGSPNVNVEVLGIGNGKKTPSTDDDNEIDDDVIEI